MLQSLVSVGSGPLLRTASGCLAYTISRNLSRALSSLPECTVSSSGDAGGAPASEPCALELPLTSSGDQTMLVSMAERPFASLARLPDGDVKRLAARAGMNNPKRVAVVRPAFLPSDQRQPPLSELVALLGPSAVALAAHTQDTPQRMLVDEYYRSGSSSYLLTTPATELATYLQRRSLRVALVPDVGAAAAAAQRPPGAQLPNSVAVALGRATPQSTNSVLMVAPTAFGFNEQAAADNSFMQPGATPGAGSSLTSRVCAEFAGLHRQLADVAGVNVRLFQHHLGHGTPDACFPNNWFSTHAAGEAAGGVGARTMVLYPMKCPNRAAERRPEVIQVLRQSGYSRVVDMTGHERHDKAYFEGTGVLVLDRVNGVAYVALSERADKELAEQWVRSLGYRELVTFRSFDARGKPVYHTNVMMAIGTDVAVVCGESVTDPQERAHLMAKLRESHEVVDISAAQMDALCGNVLELQGGRGLPVMAMSSQAYNAFTPEQRATMRRHVADLVHAPIDTLEQVGGGGVRCALAELF